MEANNFVRAPTEGRAPTALPPGVPPSTQPQQPPRPPLARADSRSTLPPQPPRVGQPPPLPPGQRPQFQPGGPVTNVPQVGVRPPTPLPRGVAPSIPPGAHPIQAPRPPPRQPAPQSFAPLGVRPLPPQPGVPQRAPPPGSLQFGPRQPPQYSATTPDDPKSFVNQPRSGQAVAGPPQLPRQPSQNSIKGLDSISTNQTKPSNLEYPSNTTDYQNKSENGVEIPGAPKNRSFSIAAPPGAPSPLKAEDDRRKSISVVGGKMEDFTIRSPGLGLIQEGKTESQDNVRGSKDTIKGDIRSENSRDPIDRAQYKPPGSMMSDSFMGSLPKAEPKKRPDDDDDVVLHNKPAGFKTNADTTQSTNKIDITDRSPSLTKSDSPELKPKQQLPQTKSPMPAPVLEPQRPKTPKTDVTSYIEPKPVAPNVDQAGNATKPPVPIQKKPTDMNTNSHITDQKKHAERKVFSAPKQRMKDGDNDSGVDESTQGNDHNGSPGSPKKAPSRLPMKEKSNVSVKSRSSSKSATVKTPETPQPADKKKVPMNKVQVGNAPSPNIKAVRSKIGSLENATYRPGGGKVKIENKKLDFNNVTPRIAAKNDAYVPQGGAKKITTTKLEWNAKSKIGSLQNTAYKPGGGDKKIETVKLDFKDKAKPKVGSTANITHKPGGGEIKSNQSTKHADKPIENQKLEFKAQSKVGSMDNVKHQPKGGQVKIFDDKEYLKQMSGQPSAPLSSTHSRQEDYYMSIQEWSAVEEMERPATRCRSARAPRTPRTLSPQHQQRRQSIFDEERRIQRNNEKNRKISSRPASAREPPRSACRGNSIAQRPAFTVY